MHRFYQDGSVNLAIPFLRVLAVFDDYHQFTFGEAAVKSLGILEEFYFTG